MIVANALRNDTGRSVTLDEFRPLRDDGPLLTKLSELQSARLRVAARAEFLAAEKKVRPSEEVERSIARVTAVANAVDAFLTTLASTSGGSSTLVDALKYESLVSSPTARIVLVKAGPQVVSGVVNDKPLWFADSFSTNASVSISYTATGRIIAGGTADGSVEFYGSIGETATYRIRES